MGHQRSDTGRDAILISQPEIVQAGKGLNKQGMNGNSKVDCAMYI